MPVLMQGKRYVYLCTCTFVVSLSSQPILDGQAGTVTGTGTGARATVDLLPFCSGFVG